MAKVTNKYEAPLGLPAEGGTVLYIQPGESAEVENWDKLKGNPTIEAWVEAKMLVVGSAPAKDEKK